MAVVQFRGSKWQCRIRKQGYPDIAKSFSTKEDALKWSRMIERQMDLGEYIPDAPQTLADLIDRYAREVTPTKKGANQERYRLAVLKADKIATMNVRAISSVAVAAFRDRRLSVVKPVTVLHDLCTLSAVFEHARLEWSISVANPVRGVRKPSAGKGRDRRLLDGEYEALLAELKVARTPWIAPLFVFCVETACRRGEALALRWEDIDLSKRIAVFRDTKVGEPRVIPLSKTAVATLEALPHDLGGRVFPLSATAVCHVFQRVCGALGITGLRWHDLRHEGVSRLHELGLSTIEVASVSGHKTLACLARYSHMKAEKLAAKIAALG